MKKIPIKLYIVLILIMIIYVPTINAQSVFGVIVGTFNGVDSYSNGSLTHNSDQYNSVNGTTTGLKWQCVEYVNRYYLLNYNLNLQATDIYGNANHYFANGASAGLSQFPNGNTSLPQVGDIICSNGGDYGHIAIVREVNADNIKVIQQNWANDNTDNSKMLTLTRSGNIYTVGNFSNNYPVIGWLRTSSKTSSPSCTFNVTVNGSNSQLLTNGWKFWRDSLMASDFYEVEGTITNLPTGNHYALYLVDPSGNPRWQIFGDSSLSTFHFKFSPPIEASNAENYKFRLTPQGNSSTIWFTSNNFCCSTLPSLSISVSPVPLVIGKEDSVTWYISGGIPTLQNGGWTGNIRLQWYQYGEQSANALSNLYLLPVSDYNYSFQVPSSIPNTTLPGNNFMIAGVADASTSLPPGLVYAFTSAFSIINNPTGVEQNVNNLPLMFNIKQNYPNPFNPTTIISYSIPKSSMVKIKVYDIIGKEVATLVNEQKSAGNYSVKFSGYNLPSGLYFYRMQAGSFVETKKLILLK